MKNSKELLLESVSDQILVVHVSMIVRSELFCPPPHGHLGCYASIDMEPFEGVEPGHGIRFFSGAGLEAEGIVTCIEKPGSCVRPDMKEFENWYKLHWIQLNYDAISQQILSTKGIVCPKCGGVSDIIDSRKKDNLVIRERRCRVHLSIKWRTTEIYYGTVGKVGRPCSGGRRS